MSNWILRMAKVGKVNSGTMLVSLVMTLDARRGPMMEEAGAVGGARGCSSCLPSTGGQRLMRAKT